MKFSAKLSPAILGIPAFLPFLWRLSHFDAMEPIGLLSDFGCGMLLWVTSLVCPVWLRLPLVLAWVLSQAAAQELYVAIQRLPSWSDLKYLADPTFVHNSVSGLHLIYPIYSGLLLLSFFLTLFAHVKRPRPRFLAIAVAAVICIMAVQMHLSHRHKDISVDSRYNPLHWFFQDALVTAFQEAPMPLAVADLPFDLRRTDMSGQTLLAKSRGKNMLIIAMEGITGLYYPEIRQAMRVTGEAFTMQALADATPGGMVVPDFVTHSHQTIRGLYSMLCGDFSEFSFDTPKAFELQQHQDRAGECLPARMAGAGWSTHYLQAAGLNFMSKDRVMPMIGFQEVHGREWFTEPDPDASMWGPSDPAFFRQAKTYIRNLQKQEKPWMLTLFTVGTHHPFQVPDEVAERYPDRKIATVAVLDAAVADFVKWLGQEKILDDTLVILTSDESHGSELAEWMSSWGFCVVLAPKGQQLPRVKTGSYGMVDLTPSILDYFGLKMTPSLVGRSIFRNYKKLRDMVSYTGGKLRWHSADNYSYECTKEDQCLKGKAVSLLGEATENVEQDSPSHTRRLWSLAAVMDRSVGRRERSQVLQFAKGEIRQLPEKWGNEWSDSLVGAQYLQFPAGSSVHVAIRVMAVAASDEGLQLKLFLRQSEQLVTDIVYDAFPVLHSGEEGKVEFNFANDKARQSFSFHLMGEGKDATVQLEEFSVTIEQSDT